MRADDAAGSAAAATCPRGPPVSAEGLVRDHGPSLELLVCGSPAAGAAPILFVHGARMGAWCWSETWLPAVGRTGRFAAAVSLRGHGHSEGRAGVRWTGLSELADDLSLAIRAMPSPPVVVAHSLGGLLAQRLLGDVATGRIEMRGLVLAGSLPPEGLALIGPWLGLSAWSATVFSGWGSSKRARRTNCLSAALGDSAEPAACAAYEARMGESAVMALAQAHLPHPVAPAFAVGVPALVLHGRADRLVNPADARRSALYHGGTCEIISQAGHFPMLGPGSAVGADLLCGWLADIG